MKTLIFVAAISIASTHSNSDLKAEFNIEHSIACSVYALVASTYAPTKKLKDNWLNQSRLWSISANTFGASAQDHALYSEREFDEFMELNDEQRLVSSTLNYFNRGCL